MFELGTADRFIALLKSYPKLFHGYGFEWSLKHFGTLFVYDVIAKGRRAANLEFGPGFNVFFAECCQAAGLGYTSIDRSNDELGIGQNNARYAETLGKRKAAGADHVEAFLGEGFGGADESFDTIFSISVVEHIDNMGMKAAVAEAARLLKPGGLLINTIDIYPKSRKHLEWHGHCVTAGLLVDPPHHLDWTMDGAKTTFLEQAKIRYLIYNSLQHKDVLASGIPFASQFATALHIARKQ